MCRAFKGTGLYYKEIIYRNKNRSINRSKNKSKNKSKMLETERNNRFKRSVNRLAEVLIMFRTAAMLLPKSIAANVSQVSEFYRAHIRPYGILIKMWN